MSDDQARQALADELRALPTPELVDVLRRVLAVPASVDNGIAQRLVLAEVAWQEGRLRGADDWREFSAVAWPDREYYDGGFGPEPELGENGTCPGCGIEVVSTAKRAWCPVCGTRCQLT